MTEPELEAVGREKKERDEVWFAVQALANLANRGASAKHFVWALQREHRTLQQVMTGMMLAWFKHLSELPDGHYDARNEASVRTAKKIMEATEGVTRLPFI